MTIRATVWGENIHEQNNSDVAALYPAGLHGCIANALNADTAIKATTATLQEDTHGLTADRLAGTDVLLWWGHAAHDRVADDVVDRICEAVWSGMGMIFLHSAHFSKPFKRLMGTPCNLTWREAGERERLWISSRNHRITKDLPDCFELENEEMYGEPFAVPEPLETVFISWFQGGEVFRSGLTYKRGAGNVFYFRPGHETYPTYHNAHVQTVLRNAVHWAFNPHPRVTDVTSVRNTPAENAPETIEPRGPVLHSNGKLDAR